MPARDARLGDFKTVSLNALMFDRHLQAPVRDAAAGNSLNVHYSRDVPTPGAALQAAMLVEIRHVGH